MTVIRQRVFNSAFTGNSGGLSSGDRGAGQVVGYEMSNPYNTNDFVSRWKSYVQMYETSWEARKIVRIIPEDALRKEWVLEDMPDEFRDPIVDKMNRLDVRNVLLRSLMLERLLGGCLTFMGIEGKEDDPSNVYHPHSGENIRFMNAIPVSRISRVSWDTNPLSEHYMRPNEYLINGQSVHTSRCLVWDGEPLFDPYDFALTNFRANLGGFGPSKLAAIWDDIIKAVGTRQAAYQLIQTNNAIIAAVSELQDLNGTKSGKEALAKVKEIANNLSVYRAAIIDSDKVSISQNGASFGSVPELLMMFLQILCGASDIPATRFIGQAPGGLNATGESDLENYYNVIDSFQRQRIEPRLRRVIDIIGYNMFPKDKWSKVRKEYSLEFPPLWNASELEEAQTHSANIDNVMKLLDAGLITEVKAIQEINAKNALSVDLDETDITLTDETGLGEGAEVNAKEEIDRLKGKSQVQVPKEYSTKKGEQGDEKNGEKKYTDRVPDGKGGFKYIYNTFDIPYHEKLILDAGGRPEDIILDQFKKGMEEEKEHAQTVSGDLVTVARIVLDHLGEDPRYYTKLGKVMNIIDLPQLPDPTDKQKHSGNYKKHHLKLHGLDIAVENPAGSIRKGVGQSGELWESELPAHYGYVKRTEGADGDHVDVFIGPEEESELVFLIDQKDINSGGFDEHKAIMGCLSSYQAKELYEKSFSDGKASQRLGGFTPMPVSQFKQWLKDGDTKQPFANEASFDEEKHPRASDGKFGKGGAKSKAKSPDKKKATEKGAKDSPNKRAEATQKRREEVLKGKTPADQKAFKTAWEQGISVPPAWTDVEVLPEGQPIPENGVIAKGKDAKGRWQTLRDKDYTKRQIQAKHERIQKNLVPVFNKKVEELKKNLDVEENQVLYLISQMAFRIGGDKQAGKVKAYGASTLLGTHVKINGDTVEFDFIGKEGVRQQHSTKDPLIMKIVKDKAGKDEPLFNTNASKVRDAWKKLGGDKPHDFRSVIATEIAKKELSKHIPPAPTDKAGLKKILMAVASKAASKLGNRPEESLNTYIDNSIFKPILGGVK